MTSELALAQQALIDHRPPSAWVSSSTVTRRCAGCAAMATEDASDIAIDVDSGVYGHRVSMADHDDADLARIRRVAAIAGLPDRPPEVTTALALSGSAAQGKIQRFPADCDFFERVHIVAPTQGGGAGHPWRRAPAARSANDVRSGPPAVGGEMGYPRRARQRSRASRSRRDRGLVEPRRGGGRRPGAGPAGRHGPAHRLGGCAWSTGLGQARLAGG